MRLLRTGFAAAVVALLIAQAHVTAQQAWDSLSHEAKKKSVAAGDAALFKACGPEINAMVADARKQGATVKDADVPGAIAESITNWWWAEGATSGIREEYKNTARRKNEGEINYAFTQCAIAVIDAWQAGVRDVARLRAKYSSTPIAPSASRPAPPPAASKPSAPAASKPAAPPARTPASNASEDPYAGAPVDCVRLGDKPGVFKNVCNFDVYFTYCGVNPGKDSWVADCSDPKQSFGLIDIGAGGVQGGFTRAEKIYTFDCKSPKTPASVKFTGKALFGTCR